jgi:hypothetical protein
VVKIKKEQINKKQNIWIEVAAVLFVAIILNVDFSSFQNIHLPSIYRKVSFGVFDVDKTYSSYTANVSGGLEIVKEELNNLIFSFNPIKQTKENFYFFKNETMSQFQTIGDAYNKGVNTISKGSINYASVFSSNLINNLGVIDRQLHTAKTNFCK